MPSRLPDKIPAGWKCPETSSFKLSTIYYQNEVMLKFFKNILSLILCELKLFSKESDFEMRTKLVENQKDKVKGLQVAKEDQIAQMPYV